MGRNKIFILSAIVVLLIVIALIIFMNFNKIALKEEILKFEYGEVINFGNEEILDTSDSGILDTLVIDLSNVELEENKNYPKVGEYKVIIRYKNFFMTRSNNFTIIVSDTIEPKFIEYIENIKVLINDQEHDFKQHFVAEDLSEFELKIDTGSVDFEKEGKYDAKVIATDIYGNKTVYDFHVFVEEPNFHEPALIVPTVKNGILIVNKKHPLPPSYNPGEDPTAVAQLKNMIADMQDQGFDISNDYSGFRTYSHQKALYEGYVKRDGQKAADKYSARPGYSEHQTGLTYDVKHNNGTLVRKTAEADWIAANASDYGFIVRYQAGKEAITGYQAEPWHLRYIGEEAVEIYKSGLTLEEYLGVEGGDYYQQ